MMSLTFGLFTHYSGERFRAFCFSNVPTFSRARDIVPSYEISRQNSILLVDVAVIFCRIFRFSSIIMC